MKRNNVFIIIAIFLFVFSLPVSVVAADFSTLIGTWNLVTTPSPYSSWPDFQGHPSFTFTTASADSAVGYNHNNDTMLVVWSNDRGQFKIYTPGGSTIFYVSVIGDSMIGETNYSELFGISSITGTRRIASQCPGNDITGCTALCNKIDDGVNGCTTPVECTGIGLYWYDNQCNATQQPQCRADNLPGCITQTDCQNAGGYWYASVCNATPQPQPQCRLDNIPGCINQAECTDVGGYWYDSTCNATAQPAPPVVDEMPVPANKSVFNYTSVEHPLMQTNPEDCKPFAVGDLSTGNLSLQVGLPAFLSGVDVYLAIGFADALFLVDSSNALQSASGISVFPKWKTNVSTAIDESLYGDIPISLLPTGVYNLYILVVPTGETDFSHYYLWSMNFNVDG